MQSMRMRRPIFSLMRQRRPRRLAAFAALIAMLFAQAALAFASCIGDPGHTGMATHVEAGHAAPTQEPLPCHDESNDDTLCLAHCQASDQTLDKHQVKVPVLAPQLLAALPPVVAVMPQLAVPARPPVLAAAPPPRILFQSLLI